MLRSQSISNLSERKPKPSFLSSLRLRRLSNKDLQAPSDTAKGLRPLSTSVSSVNLNQKYVDAKSSYTSTVARERGKHLLENKENMLHSGPRPEITVALSTETPSKTLKTRLSAPNLNGTSAYKPKRHLTMFGINTLANHAMNSPVTVFADDTTEESLIDDTNSPYTPNTANSTMGNDNVNFSPITVLFLDSDLASDDGDVVPKKLHRTANLENLGDFIRSVSKDSHNIIPISNRRSLEFEAIERDTLKKLLCKDQQLGVNLHLVENVLFISVGEDILQGNLGETFINWEEQDYADALKHDDYYDDELYLGL